MTNLDSIFKSRYITLPKKVHLVKAMVFPVVMYGCKSWTVKKAECWSIADFELWCWRTLESPLDFKDIQPVHPKGDQSWVFIGSTDVEAETPILWPPDAKCWLIWKDPDVGKDWGQEEKGKTEDEMAGWHHWLDGCESEWTPWVGDGQGGLACCNSWGCRVGHDRVTELNCSWGSQSKNAEVVSHFLLQWSTVCQNSPPWPICLQWLYTAWLIVSLS